MAKLTHTSHNPPVAPDPLCDTCKVKPRAQGKNLCNMCLIDAQLGTTAGKEQAKPKKEE